MSAEPYVRRVVTAVVEGRSVVLSLHAVKRWRERWRPELELAQAVRHLETAVAEQGSISRRRPDGVRCSTVARMLETVGWLMVDGAAFPLVEHGGDLVATTCVARRGR